MNKALKYPLVFPLLLFTLFLTLSALLSVIIISNPIYIEDSIRIDGFNMSTAADTLFSVTRSVFLQCVLITVSAFFRYPCIIYGPVLIYRGICLGYTCGELFFGNIVGASVLLIITIPLLYLAASALLIFMSGMAQRQSVSEPINIVKYLLTSSVLSGIIFILSSAISLI